jgi:hypothetical protein
MCRAVELLIATDIAEFSTVGERLAGSISSLTTAIALLPFDAHGVAAILLLYSSLFSLRELDARLPRRAVMHQTRLQVSDYVDLRRRGDVPLCPWVYFGIAYLYGGD